MQLERLESEASGTHHYIKVVLRDGLETQSATSRYAFFPLVVTANKNIFRDCLIIGMFFVLINGVLVIVE